MSQDTVAAGTEYTTTDAGTVEIAGKSFAVEIQRFHTGDEMVWLTGTRGGVYFLRKYRGADDGMRQIISWKSGKPLTVRGNEIHALQLGDVIEQAH